LHEDRPTPAGPETARGTAEAQPPTPDDPDAHFSMDERIAPDRFRGRKTRAPGHLWPPEVTGDGAFCPLFYGHFFACGISPV
jgi:hypothetical protein